MVNLIYKCVYCLDFVTIMKKKKIITRSSCHVGHYLEILSRHSEIVFFLIALVKRIKLFEIWKFCKENKQIKALSFSCSL